MKIENDNVTKRVLFLFE